VQTEKTPRITWILLICIVLFAAWMRLPFIGKDLPFFYNEDEAHHFNRTINMVKEGDLNPHYFHKPSLHFYLRIPVVVASFFWNVAEGNIKSVKEIKTADPFGLNGYALTASHPGMVKWNRAFSVVLSLLTIILTYFIAINLFGSSYVGLSAAFLLAISPQFVSESAVVGVDVVMTFFIALSVFLALQLETTFSLALLSWVGITAGLSVSSKYNAWPIFLLPFLSCLFFKHLKIKTILISITTPVLGFLLGSPFIITNLPIFMDQAGYEIWHYKIAGHEGHTATPGWEQAMFYFNFFITDSVGFAVLLLALIATIYAILRRDKKFLLFLSFPIIYFLYMIEQKVNFTRNMLPMIPFIAVLALGFLSFLTQRIKHNIKRTLLVFLTPLVLYQPTKAGLDLREELGATSIESRSLAIDWISQNQISLSDMAIAGNLNLPTQVYGLSGVTKINEIKTTASELYLNGFDKIVVGPSFIPSDEELKLLHLENYIAGEKKYSRLSINPEIRIYKFSEDVIQVLSQKGETINPQCSQEEGHCWINSRLSMLEIDMTKVRIDSNNPEIAHLEIDLMTPWPGQSVTFAIADWAYTFDKFDNIIGKWVTVTLDIPVNRISIVPSLRVLVEEIHSPLTQKISSDPRRLGVAVKGSVLKESLLLK